MTATAPDLWRKREDTSGAALREAAGVEKHTSFRKPMRLTLGREKTWLPDEEVEVM